MENQQLYSLIEKIVFNETEFLTLKEAILRLAEGKSSSKEVRELIIKNRIRILEDIVEFFPFYMKHLFKDNSVNTEEMGGDNNELVSRLKERDNLLELVGRRVNEIISKIKVEEKC